MGDGNRVQRSGTNAASESAAAAGDAVAPPAASVHPLAPRAQRIAAEQPQARYQRVLAERGAMGAQLMQRLGVMRKPLSGALQQTPAIAAPVRVGTIFRARSGGAKRGDHVFNHGLGKAFGDLAAAASRNHSSGAASLAAALDGMRATVASAPFELTAYKGPSPAGGDSNSQQFGRALAATLAAFMTFLAALEESETTDHGQSAKAHADVVHAEASAKQTFATLLATAFDPASAALLDANAAKLVSQGKAILARLPITYGAALDAAARAALASHGADRKLNHK